MSNTEPTIIPPAEPVFEGNTITFEITGNPNLMERIDITNRSSGVETFTYGYVDSVTNNFVLSHQMQRKRGNLI